MTSKGVQLLSSFASAVSSWPYFVGSSYGLLYSQHPEQAQVFGNASINPNVTASVPVTLSGGHNFTLRVNVSELSVAGAEGDLSDPRAVLTTFDVTYPQGSSYNDTFETPGPACFSTATSFRGGVAKKASADGDCSDAFGEDCVNALKGFTPDCDTFYIPSQCEGAFKAVLSIPGFDMSDKNGTQPLDIYAYDSKILSAKDSESQYNDAAQNMWFALFRNGDRPAVPVCVPPSSDAAFTKAGSVVWSVATAAAAAIWMII